MKETNYKKIASVYDNNPSRHHQPAEELIGQYLASIYGPVKVLDLACGTGNYLYAQDRHYKTNRIQWSGFDKSTEMLKIASKKNPGIEFITGLAESLPYTSDTFDIVTCNYAFHHFDNKAKVLSEVRRILKKNGFFILKNIAPEFMYRDSWIYFFYPKTRANDYERFWSAHELHDSTRQYFETVRININSHILSYDCNALIQLSLNRDMSQLSLLSDDDFHVGLESLKSYSKTHNIYRGTFATIRLWSKKNSITV